MAVIKCKMCGGDLNFADGASVVECEYCGSKQTIPNQDSEKNSPCSLGRTVCGRPVNSIKRRGCIRALWRTFPRKRKPIGGWCFAGMVLNT